MLRLRTAYRRRNNRIAELLEAGKRCSGSLVRTKRGVERPPPARVVRFAAGAILMLTSVHGCGSAAPPGMDRTREQCHALSQELPSWLSTNVPPGTHVSSAKLPTITVGFSWRRAVESDTTLGRAFLMPTLHLDGMDIMPEADVSMTADEPTGAFTIAYQPRRVLGVGRHSILFVLRDTKGNTFTEQWQFCVDPASGPG